MRDDYRSRMAIQKLQVEGSQAALPSRYVDEQFLPNHPIHIEMAVKGIYVTWAHDPQNPKIKDWNVTELKVGFGDFSSKCF